ncbi:unnamed protein product [Toxocara canis]|uniref:Bromodomain and WD repeat-containing protein 3-like n=1 Tax=Toxocara canis TaxID=6265 RepID=A0A183UII6_TOXCA|nr:unnamed protein product [Toxocara canis]
MLPSNITYRNIAAVILRRRRSDSEDKEFDQMLIDSQKRVEELRRRLDESLSLFQRQQKLNGVGSARQANDKQRRILTVLYQDNQQTLIQVSGSPSMSCPVTSLEGRICLKLQNGSASSPLQVIVGAPAEQNGLTTDSLPSSPASSVDSGVSSLGSSNSSPSASPGSSPVYIRGSPFLPNSEKGNTQNLWIRERSTSECVTSTGLKSILKKTSPLVVYKGRFARSVSECQHPDEKEAIDGLIATDVLEDIDESSESLDCATIARKKRVSFSERLVQERSFRPNSSILGQKKKNQRKSKNKLKKKASEEASTDEESKLGSDDGRESSHDSFCDEQGKTNATKDCKECNGTDHETSDAEEDINEADASPKSGAIRQRILRSSTGEEACVTFMVGDGKLERNSRREKSPDPSWLRLLKRCSQKTATVSEVSANDEVVETAVEAKE